MESKLKINILHPNDTIREEESLEMSSTHHEPVKTPIELLRRESEEQKERGNPIVVPGNQEGSRDMMGNQINPREFYVDLISSDGHPFTVPASLILRHEDLFTALLNSEYIEDTIKHLKEWDQRHRQSQAQNGI